ncbi:MAG: hypothetical protein MJ252_13985 [archaeon]|nr:hypothetical protein [archaeon]
MKESLDQFSISIMIVLILTNFSGMIIVSIIYTKYNDNHKYKNETWFNLFQIAIIIFHGILLFSIPFFGIRSVYYQKLSGLNIYIIAVLIFSFICLFSSVYYFLGCDTRLLINYYFLSVDMFNLTLAAVSAIVCLFERNLILKEEEESPLNMVNDGNMTEDMMKAILKVSKNPDSDTAQDEFRRLYDSNVSSGSGSSGASFKEESFQEENKNEEGK